MSTAVAYFFAPLLESLSLSSHQLMFVLTFVTVILVCYLIHLWWKRRQPPQPSMKANIPDAITVSRRPLIRAPSEVAFLNLLSLVSQEHFLLFAKIPLHTLVHVQAKEQKTCRQFVKSMRPFIADYVLVHPGTMLPCTIIMVDSTQNRPSNALPPVLKVICQKAAIDLIALDMNRNYSAMELRERLGLQEDE